MSSQRRPDKEVFSLVFPCLQKIGPIAHVGNEVRYLNGKEDSHWVACAKKMVLLRIREKTRARPRREAELDGNYNVQNDGVIPWHVVERYFIMDVKGRTATDKQ